MIVAAVYLVAEVHRAGIAIVALAGQGGLDAAHPRSARAGRAGVAIVTPSSDSSLGDTAHAHLTAIRGAPVPIIAREGLGP